MHTKNTPKKVRSTYISGSKCESESEKKEYDRIRLCVINKQTAENSKQTSTKRISLSRHFICAPIDFVCVCHSLFLSSIHKYAPLRCTYPMWTIYNLLSAIVFFKCVAVFFSPQTNEIRKKTSDLKKFTADSSKGFDSMEMQSGPFCVQFAFDVFVRTIHLCACLLHWEQTIVTVSLWLYA